MNKCLSAYTAVTESPPFLNASLTPEGEVEVTTRSTARVKKGDTFPSADIASMKMPRDRFRAWLVESLAVLDAS